MKKFVLLLMVLLFASTVTASLTIRIDVRDFVAGEKASFSYTLTSDRDETIIYTPRIRCTDMIENMLIDKSVSLKKDVPLTFFYEGFDVTSDMAFQQCLASIKVKSPFIRINEEEFTIGSLKTIDFNIKTCKDKACKEESKMFLKGKNIYVDYSSSIQNPEITAILTLPGKTTRKISLPTSITASQTGTYELEVAASKQGYKTVTNKEQFGVIEKEAKISGKIVSPSETLENGGVSGKTLTWLLIIGILVIAALIVYLVYRKGKR